MYALFILRRGIIVVHIWYRSSIIHVMSILHDILSGKICCTIASLLHKGHSGFSLTQSPMHSQQKTCPHCVADGSLSSSRQSVHFLCCAPLIYPMTFSSLSSYALSMPPTYRMVVSKKLQSSKKVLQLARQGVITQNSLHRVACVRLVEVDVGSKVQSFLE